LIPKKPKEILEKVIKENNLNKSFTEDAVSFFWSEIRKTLTDLSAVNVHVRRFGIFTIKHWKIDEFINNYKKHLDKGEFLTFQEAKYRKTMEIQYNRFLKLKELIEKEELRKHKTKENKLKYESAKSMGEQIQDNGGTSEQCNQEEGC